MPITSSNHDSIRDRLDNFAKRFADPNLSLEITFECKAWFFPGDTSSFDSAIEVYGALDLDEKSMLLAVTREPGKKLVSASDIDAEGHIGTILIGNESRTARSIDKAEIKKYVTDIVRPTKKEAELTNLPFLKYIIFD
ncbi:MAG: hypothetical protein NTX25_03570 [Proteobacteria bacterium]|nr:hypothetical protein [Pseudomonadota bacterium]